MNYLETPLLIPCHSDRMLGILSRPDGEQKGDSRIGVLIIVGGPQYRAGSHRQFTLLARHLAAHGIPVLRFDYRGMGDSEGEMRTFEEIDDDIRAALDAFFEAMPGMSHAVLWGLCDAASAALFHASADHRINGLVLANPWVRTERTVARTLLRHYYLKRVLSGEFWRKTLRGRLDVTRSISALLGNLRSVLARDEGNAEMVRPTREDGDSLPNRMLRGLTGFKGRVMLALSGQDYTAREFQDLVNMDARWEAALVAHHTHQVILEDADHVFSCAVWRDRVAEATVCWVQDIQSESSGTTHLAE